MRQSEKLSEIKPPLGILFTTKHLHDSKKSCNCYHVMKKITMDIFLHDLNNGLCWNRKKTKTKYIIFFVSNWPGDTLVAIVLPILKICKAEVPEAKKHLFSLVFAWQSINEMEKNERLLIHEILKINKSIF